MKKIAIILPSRLPVPAILGGAIETTIQLIIDENEKNKELDITVFSTFYKKARVAGKRYKLTSFVWIKRDWVYHTVNFIIRVIRKTIFPKLEHLDLQIIKWKINNGSFDKIIIHGNTNHLKGLSKVTKKENLVFYTHANLFNERNDEFVYIGSLPSLFVCVSNFIKRKIFESTGASLNDIVVVKNPVDFSFFKEKDNSVELRKTIGVLQKEFLILFVGRIVEDKGIKKLLEALSLLEANKPFKLVVVGSFGSGFGSKNQNDSFSLEIKTLAEDLGGKVIFTGFIHNSTLFKYYSIADIVTMPSLCEEAAGKVAMEAMASGIPVITTTAGGIPEYVSPEAGILLERDKNLVANLKIAIETLMENKELRKKMGEKGRELAKEFHPSRYYNDYMEIIYERNPLLGK